MLDHFLSLYPIDKMILHTVSLSDAVVGPRRPGGVRHNVVIVGLVAEQMILYRVFASARNTNQQQNWRATHQLPSLFTGAIMLQLGNNLITNMRTHMRLLLPKALHT